MQGAERPYVQRPQLAAIAHSNEMPDNSEEPRRCTFFAAAHAFMSFFKIFQNSNLTMQIFMQRYAPRCSTKMNSSLD